MQHPPYAPLDYAVDALWPALLAISAVLSFRSAIKWRTVYSVLSLALIPLRFFSALLFTFHLLPALPELLIVLYLLGFGVAAMWQTLRRWRATDESPTSRQSLRLPPPVLGANAIEIGVARLQRSAEEKP